VIHQVNIGRITKGRKKKGKDRKERQRQKQRQRQVYWEDLGEERMASRMVVRGSGTGCVD